MSWYIDRDRKFRLSLTGSSNGWDRGRRLYVMAGLSGLTQGTRNMMLIVDYRPKERRVRPSSHGLKSRGFVRLESTPSRPTEKAFQAGQVGLIQQTPPSWGCVQHSCKSGGPSK